MKLTIGGKQIPVALLVTMLVIAGAGAATGVTLQGDVQGESTTKVEQAINATDVSGSGAGTSGNFAGSVSDDGTAFKAGANVRQGDQYTFNISLYNNAGAAMNASLALDVPSPLEVGVETYDGWNHVRTGMGTWYLGADTNNGTIEVTVAVPDDAQPGFYTIEGAIRPTDV